MDPQFSEGDAESSWLSHRGLTWRPGLRRPTLGWWGCGEGDRRHPVLRTPLGVALGHAELTPTLAQEEGAGALLLLDEVMETQALWLSEQWQHWDCEGPAASTLLHALH